MSEPQILAIGGGGISQEPQNTALIDYFVSLTGKTNPRVCLINTASGDRDAGTVLGYRAYNRRGCMVRNLTFFPREVEDLRSFVFDHDLIHVGGGNTAALLAIWRLNGLDTILRDAWQAGIVLGGVSAGAICWFEDGITDSFGPTLRGMNDGLGFLAGSCCPHYNGELQRRPTYQRLIAEGMRPGIAIDDGCAAHFRGTELVEFVTSRTDSQGYRLTRDPETNAAVETPVAARLLG